MRFGVLGAVQVLTDRGEPVRVPELKVRALLAHLLLDVGRIVSADQLIDRLWGDRAPADPRAALQAKVSQLRRVLDDAEPGGRELVVSDPPGYRLAVPATAVDSGRFAALLDRARAEPDAAARAALLDDALELWRGPAFAEVADSLAVQPVAAGLRDQWLLAVEERAEALLDLGEHVLLAAELTQVAAEHPLRERLRAAQMRALYLAGRPNEALAVFDELRTRLRDELGTDPGPELVELHGAVLRHTLRPAEARPPARRPLPVPATELVGRDADTRRIHELLECGRLVTLVGIGGVGKTRLALAVAHELEGVRFVELDALPPDAGGVAVAEAVCRAFDMRSAATTGTPGQAQELLDQLAVAVRTVRGVLVLDNCEHVIAAAATVVARLLAAAPGLRVLATSREPLDVGGEALHAVEPLSPDAALHLFATRAAAADPGFVLDEPTARAICDRLDGIPLALELAAARVRGLGTAGLAQRLDDRFAVLAGRRRDAPSRQRTLRAMIDWSWELLTGDERAVLRRLAVFAGDCSLDAAEAVCAGADADVLDALTRLVDRSLVIRTASGRYRMLESVAAYAGERLAESGERDAVRRAHLAHYLELAELAEPQLRCREQRFWLERLDAESANLRAALSTVEDADDGLRLVDALAWYWFLRGRPEEAIAAADTVLALPGGDAASRAAVRIWRAGLIRWSRGEDVPGVDDDLSALDGETVRQARARWFLAFTQWGFGDIRQATGRLRTALRAFRESGDAWGCAAVLATEASYAAVRDDLAEARRGARRAEELFVELGDRWGRLQTLDTLAGVAEVTGDYERAVQWHATALRIAEDLALWPEIAGKLSGLGRVTMLTGDFDGAERLHLRARRMAQEQGNTTLVGYAEFGLALVERRRGDLDAAEKLLVPWLAGDAAFTALTPLAELGFIAELRGDGERALELHRAGYETALASGGGPRTVALALEGLAGAWSALGSAERAARLLGAADALRRGVGAPLPAGERLDVERIGERTRAALGEEHFVAAFAEGARAEVAELVAASGGPDGVAARPP
ncbi:BTAD domain-containing putative transcriptional regulator [Amycolatopsis suaedae]|uniref:AfsR/SARP family transcriptional regulator n=1 Tax=Amycolatopsis suaedae TaxID=2510978 RepID=A0A4Q7J7A1_9PSEU|nr:BTAD domain-containing putative transcriptional regulator [Amycolatopsis suaedae]RZQ63047.1 AfsR/SARP family transcriptional regulator [Amycolatopsis suaedae]